MDQRKKPFADKWYIKLSGYILFFLSGIATLVVWGKNVEKKDVEQDANHAALEKRVDEHKNDLKEILKKLDELKDSMYRRGK